MQGDKKSCLLENKFLYLGMEKLDRLNDGMFTLAVLLGGSIITVWVVCTLVSIISIIF